MNYQANLVSIHSAEEHHFVLGLEGGSPWLGGRRDPGSHNNWGWSDGTPWDYSDWAEEEPNDYGGDEDCLQSCEQTHTLSKQCRGIINKKIINQLLRFLLFPDEYLRLLYP